MFNIQIFVKGGEHKKENLCFNKCTGKTTVLVGCGYKDELKSR